MSNDMFSDDLTQVAEVIRPTALEAMTRAEVDIQIATAHRFPRSVGQFFKRAESLATATPEIAASMEYAKPVGGERVKGPSARLAEIVAATYGNLRVQARVIAETETEIVAQGVAHDLESNTAHSTEVAISIVRKDGKTRYGADQVATMRAAACSKARRNAIFLAVPVALCQPVIAAARKVAAGDAKTLPERRKAQMEWLASKGITSAQVLSWLAVKSVDDIGLEQMADILAAINAAKDDGASLPEIFGKPRTSPADDIAPAKSEAGK